MDTGVDGLSPFMSIDVSDRGDLIKSMYPSPEAAAGFMALCAHPPTLTAYRTSAWRPW